MARSRPLVMPHARCHARPMRSRPSEPRTSSPTTSTTTPAPVSVAQRMSASQASGPVGLGVISSDDRSRPAATDWRRRTRSRPELTTMRPGSMGASAA